MIAFTLAHGGRCHGRVGILRFVLIVFAPGWLFEALSIETGVPFGKSHYTEIMAPFIGHVPVFVMPAYCVMRHVCWSLSRLMWSRRDCSGELAQPVRVATTAAAMMVIWDLSMDPLRATVEGRWVWIDGGPYFGVPLLNFAGWFIVTLAMFAFFGAMHARRWTPRAETPGPRQGFRVAVPPIYLAFPVEYVLNGVLAPSGPQDPVWAGMTTADIHARIAVIALLTVVPLAVLGCHKALTLLVEALPRDCRRVRVRGNEQLTA